MPDGDPVGRGSRDERSSGARWFEFPPTSPGVERFAVRYVRWLGKWMLPIFGALILAIVILVVILIVR